ncbi:hypothetical protein JR338_01860 [Chloroflexota bacterium]|nr:hypothetical protein JR338_01860 [Chloroflexota bacterium]
MFRRRPIRPGRRPGDRAKVLLNQAHRLYDEGQYQRAAKLFEELAQGALRRQLPRAPFLFLQAGKAYIYAGNDKYGVVLIKAGLKDLAMHKRWLVLTRVGNQVTAELKDRGLTEASDSIRQWLDEKLAGLKTELPVEGKVVERPILPTKCPSCGGSIDPQMVEWLDGVTVECLYCGSAVRAES